MGDCGENCVTLGANSIYKEERMRFLGNIEAKVDEKGRIFLPATFRKVLSASGEANLVMRKDIFQPCLALYPESVWNQMLDSLRSRLNRWNKNDQLLFRQFVADVELITLDGSGRFLIPKRYLKMASITQQVKFIGMDDSIEIWSNDAEEQQPFMDPDAFSTAMEQKMGGSFPPMSVDQTSFEY